MQKTILNAIILIAVCAVSTGASAQNTYKCGDTYSQIPCPGAVVINATDQRTRSQKMQADMATSRDVKTADTLEKARLKQEKRTSAASMPFMEQAGTDFVSDTDPGRTQLKQRPDYFTAQVPGAKKKALGKKVSKKSTLKTKTQKTKRQKKDASASLKPFGPPLKSMRG